MKIYLVYYHEPSDDPYEPSFTELIQVCSSLEIAQDYVKKKEEEKWEEEEKWSNKIIYYYLEQEMDRTIAKGYL